VPPALDDARATLADVRKAVDALSADTRDTAVELRETLARARTTLDRAQGTLARLDQTAGGTDEARVAAVQAIGELEQTLRALRNLVEYVQTHPEAVVLGKPVKEEK
jgi:paraquat-inducible protein B